MKIKRILLMIMITMLVSTGALASNQEITIKINGVKLITDSPAMIVNNSTLVPMRAIFEAMGAKVEWENSTRTVIGTKGKDKIVLQIGNTRAYLNGKAIMLETPPIIVNNSTFVPVRFIAESLGSDVLWDAKTRTVIINDKDNSIDYKANLMESEVLKLVNIERSKIGLRKLEMNSNLSTVARIKSNEMADKDYFSHTSPTYGSIFNMMTQFGIRYTVAGENIAMGYNSAQDVMNCWLNSPGHRANILNSRFGNLGVGHVNKNGTTYWTQIFTN